ncbi:MAG: tRNA uridine(34) 5-carboxymethylaminomethyl modification radical SAM/GNAT enzyme Elp3 [Chloroflexi bacterium]|nr:tRNA uridine(34) 5-carboxymethylaminomethyl modification radical SAM/GNAT enzyme Elp3 [Chloroflexota bacterium]MCY4247278.1 tRNA uridine(34) 5-carboxymethylaminomethyl modification radical SAM/GNAT enzyme Elp3 [Chloroflexota bacterium]
MQATSKYDLDVEAHRERLLPLLRYILSQPRRLSPREHQQLMRQHPKPDGAGFYSLANLLDAWRAFAGQAGVPAFDEAQLYKLRRKPVRSLSGVTPLTLLTKPFPCPGACIFCPNDVRMPKSYLADEPGAQRAEKNAFDPYLQTYVRLQTYHNLGHSTDKIELIILGGTWSFYPETYQIWFVKRIFDALRDFGSGIDRRAEVVSALRSRSQFTGAPISDIVLQGEALNESYNQVVSSLYADEMQRSRGLAEAVAAGSRQRSLVDEYATWDELAAAQRQNERAACRAVGLVIETRPDHISADEVLRARRLGCTKVQIGFQSLDDHVLSLNKRGHDVAATRRAVKLLRLAGFKIHAHWMPNLYGSSPCADRDDYTRLFADADFRPDELKIYPCSLIESAELMQPYRAGRWKPYTQAELLELLVDCFERTPEYCRLTRVVRDIPGTDIVDGNKVTNFRQLVEAELARRGQSSRDIRAREIGRRSVQAADLRLDRQHYLSSIGEEIFLQFITDSRAIAGFLRLSLPDARQEPLLDELRGCAMIREVHVYGLALGIGEAANGRAQHAGLGTRLLAEAAALASARGYGRLAVISAVGTRDYYRQRGFVDGELYQIRDLVAGRA